MVTQWTPSLLVGVPEIDAQHQELFARIRKLLAAMRAADPGETEKLLGLLGDELVEHFATEEAWMRSSSYPHYAPHKAEHDRFVKEFMELKDRFEAKGPIASVTIKLQGWLGDWLKTHIASADRRLADHLMRFRHVPASARV